MSLGAAPAGVDVDAVEEVLERLPGVFAFMIFMCGA